MSEYYDPQTYPKEWNYLQPGTIIDQYIIERELAHGGFSSVYLARQAADMVQVAVKEYLPRKMAHRTWNNAVVANDDESKALFMRGRALFFDEAKVLAKVKHPNIVEVINFFQANSTVYMVMNYDYGLSLDKLVFDKRFEINKELILKIFPALLDGVNAIHNYRLVHLDIKPGNILIRPGYDPLLLDFGAIQPFQKQAAGKTAKVLTKGFSPLEQYSTQGILGPWSDIYAIGATMRACMDCKAPPPAPERKVKDTLEPAVKLYKRKFPENLLSAIDWAMQVEPGKRPQTIAQFKQALLQ
jgi:serine/threonine protein kinase